MLEVLPALLLTAIPTQDVARRTLSAAEMARCAGIPLANNEFVVPPGELAQVEIRAPIAFRDVGVWWHGELGQAWVQSRDVAGVDGPIESLDVDEDLSAAVGGPAGDAMVSALVHGYGQPGVSVRISLLGPVKLQDLTVLWIAAPDALREEAGLTLYASAGYPKPPVYGRSSWGASPPKCTYSYCSTTHVGVHHTASSSAFKATSWSQCAANVKGVQSYHQNTKGWCDVGYNYLVCVHGDIFEGRGGGDGVKGAHDGLNCGSMGVSLMGYFHSPHNQVPSAAMLDALEEVVAWKADQQGIDPHGTSHYAGLGGNMTNIYGHRNVKSTACPGDHLYARLPAVRDGVADKLAGAAGEIELDNPQASFYGSWSTGTSAPGKFGSDYRFTDTGYDNDQAIWVPNVPEAGNYTVQVWWTEGSNRNPKTYFGLQTLGQTYYATANQQTGGGQWNTWGSFYFPQGTSSLVAVFGWGAPGKVSIADAVRLVKD